ncbi:M1 family metallopeptidase [Leuconostocaceae bacterium ESL0958]|nr:M1 family metallopeptidase [Leuconostocaceae bacterium ESL0958]
MAAITRLYDSFQPAHYDLYLDISRQDKLIAGQTTIFGTVSQTDLALHQHDLNILTLSVNGQEVPFTMHPEEDQVRFQAAETGDIRVDITYEAALTDNMNGIYPSYYEQDGQSKQLVGTQFETYFARQAFPSIDEPEAKATFSLALKFDEQPGEIALGNMPEEKVVEGVHYFQKTVKMSTYLVAFVFGDLQSVKSKTASGVEVGVFSTKAHPIADLDFALDIAKRSIDFYEDYYQTPYPLPHSWQVALPDFSAGAMENWGLVTYREIYLLVDQAKTPLATKQVTATVIAHELAHQWFGDLVTMKWWDELWLNESFANMMEFVATDALEPDWHIWESFNAGDVMAALRRDALPDVQPVHVAVNHPEEIDALFDPAIVYAKGARLLVMLRSLIGDEALRAGLKQYFEQKQYGNATGDDLWAALGAASGQDIGAVMKTWLDQSGYPLLHVWLEDGRVKVKQTPFSLSQAATNTDKIWQVPLAASASSVPNLLTTQTADLGDYEQLKAESQGAFSLNVGNTGHYLVAYDQELLAEQVAQLQQADAISQAQFLQNGLLLAQANQMSYADLLTVLPLLADSPSALVQSLLMQVIAQVKYFAAPKSTVEQQLQAFVGQLTQGQLDRLGYQAQDSDQTDDALVRPKILSAAFYAQNRDLQEWAHARFEQVGGQIESLPTEARLVILKNELQNYNQQATFDAFLQAYQATANAAIKADLRAALVSTPEPKQLATIVAAYQQSDIIKPQDLRHWFVGVLANPAGQSLAWDWARQNWDWIEAKLGGDMSYSSYVTVIAQVFKTADRLAEFKAFFEPKKAQPGLSREIALDEELIASRVAVIEAQGATVAQTLDQLTK